MSAAPAYRRIATEEAWAPKELLALYRRELEAKTLDDPGFHSLWGFFGGRSERAQLLVKRIPTIADRGVVKVVQLNQSERVESHLRHPGS